MNPAMQELGYVPAATESWVADSHLNTEIQRDTIEDKTEASNSSNNRSGRTSPEFMDGLGTRMRFGIKKVKGPKRVGHIEPKRHRLRKNEHLQHLRHPRHHRGDDDSDSVQLEDIAERTSGYDTEPRRESEKQSIHDSESIVEPIPGDSVNDEETDAQAQEREEAMANPEEFPNADIQGAVKVEKPIIDDEVDDFVTEQLYIHSKLMIVDDRIIICGSGKEF
jgi:hypothetical protein